MRSSNAFAQDVKEKAAQKFEVVKDTVIEHSKEAGKKIDADAHRRPWFYVGFTALFTVIFGFFVGRKSKRD
jgi:ElaB/YqjD/DUF883 family membrane-anchored ribosome-binding protein